MADNLDVLILRADDDREQFGDPLVTAMRGYGLAVRVGRASHGEDERAALDEGLRACRFGVVLVTDRFFDHWIQVGLSALFNLEASDGTRRSTILPVHCGLTPAQVAKLTPLLAARTAVAWSDATTVAWHIAEAVRKRPDAGDGRPESPIYSARARHRVQRLIGRDRDRARLIQAILEGTWMRVSGVAGVGKTELALHVVHSVASRNAFPGGIFWFENNGTDLMPAWREIAEVMGVSGENPDERARAAVRQVSHRGRALIVLDDILDWTDSRMPSPLPSGPGIVFLALTQNGSLGGAQFIPHRLTQLSDAASAELLGTLTGRDLSGDPQFERFLEVLSGNPLALELAGIHLREFNETISDYLRQAQDGMALDEEVRDQVRGGLTVDGALDVTWARLNGEARAAMRVAGWFAPGEASFALLEACGVGRLAQRTLRQYHLLGQAPGADLSKWGMLPLLRAYARRKGTAEEREAAQRAFIDGCAHFASQIKERPYAHRSDEPHFEHALERHQTVFRGAINDDRTRAIRDVLARIRSTASAFPARDLVMENTSIGMLNFAKLDISPTEPPGRRQGTDDE